MFIRELPYKNVYSSNNIYKPEFGFVKFSSISAGSAEFLHWFCYRAGPAVSSYLLCCPSRLPFTCCRSQELLGSTLRLWIKSFSLFSFSSFLPQNTSESFVQFVHPIAASSYLHYSYHGCWIQNAVNRSRYFLWQWRYMSNYFSSDREARA